MAQAGEKFDVAGLPLLHPLIERIVGRLIHTSHAVCPGEFVGDCRERGVLPGLVLLGLPDLCAEGQGRSLDGNDRRGEGVVYGVQLAFSAGENRILSVPPPVLPNDHRIYLQLCGGGGVNGLVQPFFHPDSVPVVELDLNVVRLVRLVIGVGKGFEVGLDGFGDVGAGKRDPDSRPAG